MESVTIRRYRWAFSGSGLVGPWRSTAAEASTDLVYEMGRVPRWERGGLPELQYSEFVVKIRAVQL